MPDALFAVPVEQDGIEMLEQVVGALTGDARSVFDDSRREMGLRRLEIRLQTQPGPLLLFDLEAEDPNRALNDMARGTTGLDLYMQAVMHRAVQYDPDSSSDSSALLFTWDAEPGG